MAMAQSGKKSKGLSDLIIILFSLVILGGGYFYFFINKDVREIVNEQLAALHQHDIQKAYYDFTSAQYQEKVSFPLFKRFVQAHPALNENESIRFYNQEEEKDNALLSAQLIGPHRQTAPILYRFVKSAGVWKIDEMQLSDYGAHQNNGRSAMIADAKEEQKASNDELVILIAPVEGQLKALREGRLEDAFSQYTSEEFRKATPHDAFMDFMKEFPELTHHTAVSFNPSASIDADHKGRVQASLIYQDKSYPIDFILVQENGIWKIWSFRIQPAAGEKIPLKTEEQAPHNQLIQEHLARVAGGSIDTAYITHASSQFKEATSLDRYREFIHNYPEITHYNQVDIGQAEEREGMHLVPVIFHTDKGKSHFDFWFVKEKDASKIWAVNVVNSASFPAVGEEEKKILSEVITEQLDALKRGDISKAYYGYGSDDFEKATSFIAFKEFINHYPIFRSYTEFKIGEAVMEGELRLVKVELNNEKERAEVDYRLNKEGKNWKVWGLQILTVPKESLASHDEDAIKSLLIEQLEAVRKGDVSKAYYAFTSKDFQESTSKEMFEKFLNSQPVYGRNAQFQLNSVKFDADRAEAQVEMRSKSDEVKSVEFKFIYEANKWKIFALKIVKDLTPQNVADVLKEKRLKFDHVLIGDQVDAQGMVIENKSEFDPKNHEITANIFVNNGISGVMIGVQLEHLETGSQIPAVETALKEDGSSIATFIFSAPSQGWPAGNYKLRVHASTGQEASYSFKVNRLSSE